MQPPSLRFIAQTIVIRTLVCSSADSKERNLLLETLKTTKGTCLTEDILLSLTELFPKELTDELLWVLAPEHLRQLKIKNCGSLTCDGVVKAITKCKHLTYIDFSCCENLLRPAIYCCLKDNVPNITHLCFEDCELMMDDGVQIILMCCPGLEHLNISSCNNITDKAFAMSSITPPNKSSKSSPKLSQRALLGGKNLSSVDLSGCQSLTSAVIRNLVALCGPTLTSINISWTHFGCIALLYLAGLSPQEAIHFVKEVDSSCLEAIPSLSEDEDGIGGNHGEDLDQGDENISDESNCNNIGDQSSCLEKDEHDDKINLRNASNETFSFAENSTESKKNTLNNIAKSNNSDENKVISKKENSTTSFTAVESINNINLLAKESTSSARSNFKDSDHYFETKSDESSEIEKRRASSFDSTRRFTKVDEMNEVSNVEDVKHLLNRSGKELMNQKIKTIDVDSTEDFEEVCEDSNAGVDKLYYRSGTKMVTKNNVEVSNIGPSQSTEFEDSIQVNCQCKNGKNERQGKVCSQKRKRELETNKLKEENSGKKNDNLDLELKPENDFQEHAEMPSKLLKFPTEGLPLASTSSDNKHTSSYSSMKALEEDWMLAWQQLGDDESCSDNDELFDSMWGDAHESSHVDSVSSVFGDAISCLTSALVHLESTDDDDDDSKVLQKTSMSTSDVTSSVGGEGDDVDDVKGNLDTDDGCSDAAVAVAIDDDGNDAKLLYHPPVCTSHANSGDGDGNGDDDDDDGAYGCDDNGGECDGDGDGDGDGNGDDVDDGDGGGGATIIVPHDVTAESGGNVSSGCFIDHANQEESIDDADDLFTDILNLQEWRTGDSSSLLHGFNDAIVSLTNAMFELMDSDDDDDDGDDDGVNDGIGDGGDDDGDGDGDGDEDEDDGDGDVDEDDDDGGDDVAGDDDGVNDGIGDGGDDDGDGGGDDDQDTCKVHSLNPVTLEQINLVMLSQDNNATNSNILDGNNSSLSVQNHIIDTQASENKTSSNISTKEPLQQHDDIVTDLDILDGKNTAVSKSSILTQCSEDENVQLPTKLDTLASEVSCESPSIEEKTVGHQGSSTEYGLVNGHSESNTTSCHKTNVGRTCSSKDDNLAVPYATGKGKEPLLLTLTYKPRLHTLDITNIYFNSKALGVACLKFFFSVNTTLRNFAVSWSELDDDTLVAMVTNQPELRSLTLTDCEKVRDPSLLSLPVHCPLLETIDLRGVAFVTDLGVVPMLNCPSLKTISLAETSVTDITMFALAEKCGDKLRDLDLSWCEELTDKGRCVMTESCTGLQSLALRQCAASRITMETLSIYCQSMTSLNVSSVGQLTDQLVITLVTNMPNLTFVDMSWNSDVTSMGVTALLSHCSRLEEAVLSGLKTLTTKPFFGIISDLPRWRTKQEIMLRRKLKNKQNGGPIETYIKPCDMETAKSLGEELPYRSTTYSPVLRHLVLEYSDMVNDEHLSQIVAVCRGTINIKDYYGQPIEPMWVFL